MFEPHLDPMARGEACCDYVSRGIAYSGGKIFMNTLDGQTIAVDAETGHEVWRQKMTNIHVGETMTMAPIVIKDHVIIGNAGSQLGARGWIAALDVNTGAISWKAYSTGSEVDCKIGPELHPFYESDRGIDLGFKSWPGDHWKIGGGTVWGWISYDPDLDLLFHGS